MISWIIASHDVNIFNRNIGQEIYESKALGDEVIVIRDAESITNAYTLGQEQAAHSIRCYIHHDVRILNLDLLRKEIINGVDQGAIVGLIGSRSMSMPWWLGAGLLGSVWDRDVVHNYGEGGPCAIVDGLLLATRHHVNWDVSWPGWHGYDHDICTQMIDAGFVNWCITGGHQLVHHNSDSAYQLSHVDGWDDAVKRYQAKWG